MSRLCAHLHKGSNRKIWQIRYRLPGEANYRSESLGVRDKQVAQRKLSEWVEQKERELSGIAPPKRKTEARHSQISALLEDFLDELVSQGVGEKYVKNMRGFVTGVCTEAGWATLADVSKSGFNKWRRENITRKQPRSPRTLNHYLSSFATFANWLVEEDYLDSNPLASVKKVKCTEQKRERRALTASEVAELLRVATPDRRLVYLVALHTGLRRAELEGLCWGDLTLDEDPPHLVARASTTKNDEEAHLFLHDEVVAELKRHQPDSVRPNTPVLKVPHRLRQFRRDLDAAGIEFVDDFGKRADFHALRKTFNTRMAGAKIPTRIAMQAMRHSEERLTTKVYTDQKVLPVAQFLRDLPPLLPAERSHIRSHGEGTECHDPTQPEGGSGLADGEDPDESSRSCPVVSPSGTPGQAGEVVRDVGFEPTTPCV